MSFDAAVYLPSTSDLPSGSDPNGILAAVSEGGTTVSVTLTNPTPSNTPDTAVSWQADIVDLFGHVRALDPGDVLLSVLRVATWPPPPDVHAGVALVAADGRGFACRVASVGGAWQIQHATRRTPATAWSAWTKGVASPSTRGAVGQFTAGTDDTQSRVNGYPVDATGTFVPTTSAPTEPTTFSGGLDFTKCRFFVGWMEGTGTAPAALSFDVGLVQSKLLGFPAVAGFFAIGPPSGPRAAVPTTFVLAGQSNAEGTRADVTWGGTPLPPGVQVIDRGIALASYPNDSTPKCGPLPYLVARALDNGAPEVRLVRRSANGQNLHSCTYNDLPAIFADLDSRGWSPDYWVLWQGEAETLDPAQSPAARYATNLKHYVELVLGRYPDCRVVLPTLLMRTDNYGGFQRSASWPLVLAAQLEVAAALPDRVLLADTQVPTPLARVDAVHASPDAGGGYDVAMSRVRDLWSL